jgi:hypothetical protein
MVPKSQVSAKLDALAVGFDEEMATIRSQVRLGASIYVYGHH